MADLEISGDGIWQVDASGNITSADGQVMGTVQGIQISIDPNIPADQVYIAPPKPTARMELKLNLPQDLADTLERLSNSGRALQTALANVGTAFQHATESAMLNGDLGAPPLYDTGMLRDYWNNRCIADPQITTTADSNPPTHMTKADSDAALNAMTGFRYAQLQTNQATWTQQYFSHTAAPVSGWGEILQMPYRPPKLEPCPGWLAPMGDYYACDYANCFRHGDTAEMLIRELQLVEDEESAWMAENRQQYLQDLGWVRVDYHEILAHEEMVTTTQKAKLKLLMKMKGESGSGWKDCREAIRRFLKSFEGG